MDAAARLCTRLLTDARRQTEGIHGRAHHERHGHQIELGQVPQLLAGELRGHDVRGCDGLGGQPRMECSGAGDQELEGSRQVRQDPQPEVDDGVGSVARGLFLEPRQRHVPDAVVHLRKFVDLTSGHRPQRPREPRPDAERVGDIPHRKSDGRVSGVQVAIEIDAGRGRRKERPGLRGMHRGALREKLGVAGEGRHVAHDARDATRTVLLRFLLHASDGRVPPFRDELRDLSHFASGERAAHRLEPSAEAEGEDAVAHDDLADREALEREAEDLVARHAGDDHRASIELLQSGTRPRCPALPSASDVSLRARSVPVPPLCVSLRARWCVT